MKGLYRSDKVIYDGILWCYRGCTGIMEKWKVLFRAEGISMHVGVC